ncbi:MAG TPA: type II toxin-antitoxin system CcdA family antitoxin [Pseudonocardiaceae bacterium]|nr:type II toxin-antitoxin system CcdA family antitoxin [Pseudonocardiaceae bacterium]
MPEQAKRKVSITLDADLVDALAAQGGALSSRVNDAVRQELARLRRHEALGALLDRLAAERGPLDTPEDEAEMRRFAELLGGRVTGDEDVAERPGGSAA